MGWPMGEQLVAPMADATLGPILRPLAGAGGARARPAQSNLAPEPSAQPNHDIRPIRFSATLVAGAVSGPSPPPRRLLLVLDDLDLLGLATRTFERSAVMIGALRLDRCKPHFRTAFWTDWPFERGRLVVGNIG